MEQRAPGDAFRFLKKAHFRKKCRSEAKFLSYKMIHSKNLFVYTKAFSKLI